jgi:hypothetical protein
MMEWGDLLLKEIAAEEWDTVLTWPAFLESYPFFSTRVSPKGNAYLINRLIRGKAIFLLRSGEFKKEFEKFSRHMGDHIKKECSPSGDGHPVHRLDVDRHFLDFLRLSVAINRLHRQDALHIKFIVDREIDLFKERVGR